MVRWISVKSGGRPIPPKTLGVKELGPSPMAETHRHDGPSAEPTSRLDREKRHGFAPGRPLLLREDMDLAAAIGSDRFQRVGVLFQRKPVRHHLRPESGHIGHRGDCGTERRCQ